MHVVEADPCCNDLQQQQQCLVQAWIQASAPHGSSTPLSGAYCRSRKCHTSCGICDSKPCCCAPRPVVHSCIQALFSCSPTGNPLLLYTTMAVRPRQVDLACTHRCLASAGQGASSKFYSYPAFLAATADFPGFATSSSDPDVNRRELAAFLAHISHETTGGGNTGGLCWITEGKLAVVTYPDH